VYLFTLFCRITLDFPVRTILITPARASDLAQNRATNSGNSQAPNSTTSTSTPALLGAESSPPYRQAEVAYWFQGTQNPGFLRRIIKCESQNTNVARMDSSGLISFGILQFNGTARWNTFSTLADLSDTPMNPIAAIKVADWMITHEEIRRWTCAKLTGLIDKANNKPAPLFQEMPVQKYRLIGNALRSIR
jgi:hypothetical protein